MIFGISWDLITIDGSGRCLMEFLFSPIKISEKQHLKPMSTNEHRRKKSPKPFQNLSPQALFSLINLFFIVSFFRFLELKQNMLSSVCPLGPETLALWLAFWRSLFRTDGQIGRFMYIDGIQKAIINKDTISHWNKFEGSKNDFWTFEQKKHYV